MPCRIDSNAPTVPLHDRPRERLATMGPGSLTDAELVAILLGTGRSGEGVLALAQRVLSARGGVEGLAASSVAELADLPGVGQAKAARLASAFALADRARRPAPGESVRSSADVAAIASAAIGRERNERVLLIVLDAQHRVRATEVIAQGEQGGCLVPTRDVLAAVLRHDGVAFALAHNHPSGRPEPSDQDVRMTRTMERVAGEVGLRLLDHVVVAGGDWRSILNAAR